MAVPGDVVDVLQGAVGGFYISGFSITFLGAVGIYGIQAGITFPGEVSGRYAKFVPVFLPVEKTALVKINVRIA